MHCRAWEWQATGRRKHARPPLGWDESPAFVIYSATGAETGIYPSRITLGTHFAIGRPCISSWDRRTLKLLRGYLGTASASLPGRAGG